MISDNRFLSLLWLPILPRTYRNVVAIALTDEENVFHDLIFAAIYLAVWLDMMVSYTKSGSMLQAKRSLQSVLDLLLSLSSTIGSDNEAQCSAGWINGTKMQFVAFS